MGARKNRIWAFSLFLIFLLSQVVSGHSLAGTVYEFEDISPVSGAVVKVYEGNLLVSQAVADKGNYSFSLDEGDYVLVAEWFDARSGTSLEDSVNVSLREDARVDLLLFPSLEYLEVGEVGQVSFPADEEEFGRTEENSSSQNVFLLGATVVIAALAVVAFLVLRKRKKLEEKTEERIYDDVERVFRIVKKSGKVSQGEIIELTNFSPAKVSMILRELEERKRIKRDKIGSKKIITALE